MEQRLAEGTPVEALLPVGRKRPATTETKRWKQVWKQYLITTALVISDILLAFVVWSLAYALQRVWGGEALSNIAILTSAKSMVAWIALRAMLGLYPGYGLDWAEQLRRHTYSVFAAAALTAIFAVAFQYGDLLSRLKLSVGFVGLLILTPFIQYFTKVCLKKSGVWGKPVFVISSGETGEQITSLMEQEWGLGYEPVAVFNYHFAPSKKVFEDTFETTSHEKVTMSEIAGIARKRGVNTVIFATPHTRREQVARLVDSASTSFQHTVVIPNLGGVTNSAVVARDFAGTFGVEIKHNLLNPWSRRAKRALDLFGAIVGGLLISPLLLTIAVFIKLDSPGPVFYGQRRLGDAGREFACWKFRTMHKDAESLLEGYLRDNPQLRAEWEESLKLREDPRVTRVGRFLRKTSLDELPQLWNVLKGEMSLVGPRPIVRGEVDKYGEGYRLYQRVKSGMSGLWQVSGRSNLSYSEQVAMDSYYVRNWSVWLDLVILARTVKTVLLGQGAY